ncbi:RusA family crossover junction endodeoxyribonuclease [Fundicoccus sp. Sow4_F4]|uniref:RusA family crossover junction endodeoxyribonuclease n=1 Tax=Fundicoccus sp. Sow4_F4 TaxID=3438783 RepID=UPI003F8F3D90
MSVKGKPIFYEPDDLKQARSMLKSHLAAHVPNKKYEGPLQCTVKWFFHNDKKTDGEWRHTKPDTHNLNKLLFNVMSDLGYWVDDARVVSEHIQKF